MRDARGRVRVGLCLLGFVLSLAVAWYAGPASAQTTNWPALIQAAKPAVVWILAETAEGTAAGSGAIISPDGYILTAAHVAAGASSITVVVTESRKFRASVVRSDATMDVAVLKISASGLTWLGLGDSDQVAIEDEVRVLGYPLPSAGVGFIAVAGIIQGTRDRNGVTLLQHNASTAGGHSGGPVINAQGQVIGVHSAVLTDQPEYHLAISVNDAKTLLPWGAVPSGPSPVQPTGGAMGAATMVRVPQDQPSLAAAARAAAEGAEIQVAAGTYPGDVSITKTLTITGESGTTIGGVVRISGVRNATLISLRVTGGVEIRDSASFTLDRVTVASGPGDAVLIEASTGVITGCTIEDAEGAGVVASFTSRITVTTTTVRRSAKAGISLTLNSQARITECTVEQNRGDGITVAGSTADIQDTAVRDNSGCGIRADGASAISGSASSASVKDNQGGSLCGAALRLDSEGPTILARIEPQPNASGWNSTSVQLTFLCTDSLSGMDGCPEPKAFEQEGVHEVTGEAVDKVGNRASVTVAVRIDRTLPTGILTINDRADTTTSSAVALRISGSDGLSGVAEMRFSNDGQTWSPWERYTATRGNWDLTAYGGAPKEGPKTVHAQVRDWARNVSSVFSSSITLLASSSPLPAPRSLRVSPSVWTKTGSFAVDWDDPAQIPPRTAAWYKLGTAPEHPEDGTRVTARPFQVNLPVEGEHLLYVWLEDESGHTDHNNWSTVSLRYDETQPRITVGEPQGAFGIEGWCRSDVTVVFAAADNLSGLAPDGRSKAESSRTTSGEGGEIRLQFSALDAAGNTADVLAGPFKVDKTVPTIAAEPSRPPDRNSWYNQDVTIAFRCEDRLSGIASCTQPVIVSQEGRDMAIQGAAEDKAGNRAAATVRISLDKTPPTGSLTINDGVGMTTSATVTLGVSASDYLSGAAEMHCSNDGQTWSDWESLRSPRPSWSLTGFGGSGALGTKTVFVQVRDRAGNTSTAFAATIHLTMIRLGGHTASVQSVAFSPDGKMLASGSIDRTIRLWETATGREVLTLEGHTSWVNTVAFSPDGKLLASGSGVWDGYDWKAEIRLWEVATGRVLRTLTGHASAVYSVAFSPDRRLLASGAGDNTVRLWDVESGALIRTLAGHPGGVESVSFSPDGRLLAAGGALEVRLWNVASGSLVRTLAKHRGSVESVAFSPDGRLVASGSDDETITLTDVATGAVVRTIAVTGQQERIRSVAFSPNGKLLASGAAFSDTVCLWDVATGGLVSTLEGRSSGVISVRFSPDGKLLASGTTSDAVELWDMSAVTGR